MCEFVSQSSGHCPDREEPLVAEIRGEKYANERPDAKYCRRNARAKSISSDVLNGSCCSAREDRRRAPASGNILDILGGTDTIGARSRAEKR